MAESETDASDIRDARHGLCGEFSDFLSSREDASRPWFFWFGCREPHRRYEYGSGAAKGGRTTGEIDRVPAFWPDNETVRNDMLDYGSRSNIMTGSWG